MQRKWNFMPNNFWKDKKVLITGGTSFVGKNLTRKLDELGAESRVFGSKQYDLTNADQANAVMNEGTKYDFIVHMAALQHAADWPMHHTAEQFHVNGLIQINTLEAWRKFQPQAKMIAVGSSCVYPSEIPIIAEKDIDQGHLHDSVYAYGATKRFLGIGVRAYKDQHKLRGIVPTFATLYGPHDDFDIKTAHVVGALVAKFCKAKATDQPEVEVWGDGTQTRELIFIDDQLEGLLMAAEHYEGDPTNYHGDTINIGSGAETPVSRLAETIRDVSGFRGDIRYNPNRFVGVKNKVLDISRAERELGWTHINRMHGLEEGLAKTVAWYEENVLTRE